MQVQDQGSVSDQGILLHHNVEEAIRNTQKGDQRSQSPLLLGKALNPLMTAHAHALTTS